MDMYGYATPVPAGCLNTYQITVGFDLAPPGYPLGMTAAPHKWGALWLPNSTGRAIMGDGGTP